jgi:hypothetical protein
VKTFTDKLVLVDRHTNPDPQWDNLAPDISVYADGDVPDADTNTDFSKIDLFIELKLVETSDPFRDPKDPLRPQAEEFRFENDSGVSRLNCGQICSYAAAHTGSQFRVHTFTLSICGQSTRFIRVGIMPARLLPRASIISKNPISLPTFSGVTHILTIANADMTRLSHQHRRRISSRSSMSKIICRVRIPLIMNSVLSWFQTVTTRRLKHLLSYHFLRKTWLAHCSDKLPDRCYEDERDRVSEVLLESGCVRYGEGSLNLHTPGIKGCSNITPFGKGNNVRHHTTLTNTLRNEKWAYWLGGMVPLSQYRMSLGIVARLLTSFKSSREFVSAIADAMTGKT